MLKILGRTPSALRVSESRQGPRQAREVRFTCSACRRSGTIAIPWDVASERRQDLIRAALDEHRRIGCTVRDSTVRRTYEIEYPRK